MTDHEMRIRFAEAMGWTEIRDIPAGGLVGVPPGGGGALTPLPNPLESDSDAARLRAWCGRRGWRVRIDLEPGYTWGGGEGYGAWPAVEVMVSRAPVVEGVLVRAAEEPDPLRRERLALCRAVCQALDAIEVGGTDE
jgi:hypothetical protein